MSRMKCLLVVSAVVPLLVNVSAADQAPVFTVWVLKNDTGMNGISGMDCTFDGWRPR